jgi:hypothetical protein
LTPLPFYSSLSGSHRQVPRRARQMPRVRRTYGCRRPHRPRLKLCKVSTQSNCTAYIVPHPIPLRVCVRGFVCVMVRADAPFPQQAAARRRHQHSRAFVSHAERVGCFRSGVIRTKEAFASDPSRAQPRALPVPSPPSRFSQPSTAHCLSAHSLPRFASSPSSSDMTLHAA